MPVTLGNQNITSSTGNLGIGTSSPAFSLDVNGNGLRIKAKTASDFAKIGFTNAAGNTPAWLGIDGNQNGSLSFHVASNIGIGAAFERMRIDSAGNVGIGTSSPSSRLTVAAPGGTANIPTARISRANDGTNSTLLELAIDSNTTDRFFLRALGSGATVNFQIMTNGNVQNPNNSYGSISDAKLKENIVDATPKLERLQQVRVVNYNLKRQPNQRLLGVIAQELEQIFPGMVDESPDHDKEGNDLGTTTKSVKYSVFVPMLIKGLQELKAELDTVKAELQTLKGN